MANTDQTQPARSVLERHVQTILTALILAVLGWVGNTLVTVSEQQAVQTVQIQSLNEKIADLKEGTKDRYTRSEAVRDREILNDRVNAFERRLGIVEDQLNDSKK